MNYLEKMYGSKTPQGVIKDKNPNRVLGGLRGQGSDHYSMLGEDGMEREVPTRAYVQGLEEKLRAQDLRIEMLEKKVRKLS
jgi:hypothetical protein